MNKNKKGFTLIELIAVLVILAIIALIVTPLVLNVIRKAKDSANKRSVDAYGKAIELAVATYLLDNSVFPNSVDELTTTTDKITKKFDAINKVEIKEIEVKNDKN